jgi:hypothetical protein
VALGLAFLLVVSLAAPVMAQSQAESSAEWRTLAPPGDEIDRANHTPIDTDVSAVLERDAVRFANRHRMATLDIERDLAASDSARYDHLAGELEYVDGRLDAMTRQEESLTERYGDDEIDGRTLLNRFATIGVRANAIEDRLVAIRVAGRDIESRAIVRRANDQLARVQVLQGTVRSQVATAQRGAARGTRFYTEAANRSLTLATATEQDYLREVSLPKHRRDGGTAIGLSDAVSIVGESYPDVYAARQSIEVGGSRRAGFYRVGIAGTGEFLTAYVDADSRAVFREDRRASLARLTVSQGVNVTQSDYRLSVDTTYRGGPARVVVEQRNGEPIDARVRVGNRTIGSTGDDGYLWTTVPARTTVEAVVDDVTLSVPVETRAPSPLNRTAP